MQPLLSIHTATSRALVVLSNGKEIVAVAENHDAKEHSAFLHRVIEDILDRQGLSPDQLAAIAVTEGPGSYTGIRVGLSAAKGLCFALQKPLITLNTLHVLAFSSSLEQAGHDLLFCPMIDARRMEVFTALYDRQMQELLTPRAVILTDEFLADWKDGHQICFCGDGAFKMKNFVQPGRHIFEAHDILPGALATLSNDLWIKKSFADLAYSKPLYLKEFHSA